MCLNQYSSVKYRYSSGSLKVRTELLLKDNSVQRMIIACEQMVNLQYSVTFSNYTRYLLRISTIAKYHAGSF